MAYQGYLLKVGNYVIPHKYMRADTYKVTYNGQDLDSYRDADGVLHRQALDHFVGKVEFNVPHVNNNEMQDLLANIRLNYSNQTEKKSTVKFYVPELNDYLTQDMYMPDIDFQIYGIFGDVIEYSETRLAFIGY